MSEKAEEVLHSIVNTPQKIKCEFVSCSSTFSRRSGMRRHMRLSHTEDGKFKRLKTAFQCSKCTATYNTKHGLKDHSKKKHGDHVPRKANMKCSIETCQSKFCTMLEVIYHLNQNHDQHLEYEYLDFQNETDFQEWLVRIEKETPCRFILKTGPHKNVNEKKLVHYYHCNRSGYSNLKSEEERQRQLKFQGSRKIERTCSAHIVKCRKSDDVIQVKYLSKHFCHTSRIEQLGHLRSLENDCELLDGKLAQKTPVDGVLHVNKECDFAGCNSKFKDHISLFWHKKTVHGIRELKEFVCDKCSNSYSSTSGLMRHRKSKHDVFRRKKNAMKCAIESCQYTCQHMNDLILHLNENHDQNLEYEHLQFENEAELQEWQVRIEKETPCKFLKRSNGVHKARAYYYCTRSGSRCLKPLEERNRRLKIQGSNKIDRTCTAHFITYQKSADCLEVKYMAKHFCHTSVIEQLGHITFSEIDRKWLAGNIVKKMPTEIRSRKVRSNLSGSLKRIQILSKQKLAHLKTQHDESLKCVELLDTIATVLDREWLVQSESNHGELYTVKRIMNSCDGCGLVCEHCEACIHLYSCTCADNSTHFNMCKHIHLVCLKYPVMNPTGLHDNSDNKNFAVSETDDTCRPSEEVVPVSQLSCGISNVEQNRQKALQLCTDVMQFVKEAGNNELVAIIECLKTLEPKLGGNAMSSSSTSSSTNFVETLENTEERQNGAVEPQKRFLSKERERVEPTMGLLPKPTNAERSAIQNNPMLLKPLAPSIQSSVKLKDSTLPLVIEAQSHLQVGQTPSQTAQIQATTLPSTMNLVELKQPMPAATSMHASTRSSARIILQIHNPRSTGMILSPQIFSPHITGPFVHFRLTTPTHPTPNRQQPKI